MLEGSAVDAIAIVAPSDPVAVSYDRVHLALYASLLEAADQQDDWQHVAAEIMRIDVAAPGAEACWRSHLERARWIVGEGLAEAITGFGSRSVRRIGR